MTEREELAVFDDEVIAAVADDHGLDPDRLRSVAFTHQANVRALPGVEDIVYEWRNYFHQDPLVSRTEAAYYLALPEHVWEEFTDDLELDDRESQALLALHDRQARESADEVGLDTARLDSDAAVVLTRP
jgi:hypothetical protein